MVKDIRHCGRLKFFMDILQILTRYILIVLTNFFFLKKRGLNSQVCIFIIMKYLFCNSQAFVVMN